MNETSVYKTTTTRILAGRLGVTPNQITKSPKEQGFIYRRKYHRDIFLKDLAWKLKDKLECLGYEVEIVSAKVSFPRWRTARFEVRFRLG